MVTEAARRQFWQSAVLHYDKEFILESPVNQKVAQAISIYTENKTVSGSGLTKTETWTGQERRNNYAVTTTVKIPYAILILLYL